MTDDDMHLLAGAFALDALDADEAAAFEAHLPQCSTCTTAVAEFKATAAEVGERSHHLPPPSLKSRIMAEVANTPQQRPLEPVELARWRRPSGQVFALAAAALFVIVGAVAAFGIIADRSDQQADLLAAPDAATLTLDPIVDQFGEAKVDVVWSREQDRALVQATNLPDAGEGKTYQLWFVTADGVAPAGLFATNDGDARVILDLDDVDGIGWGISIEPEAGSPAPTTEVILLGLA